MSQRDKHLTFDLIPPAGVPSDPTATKYSAEEWLEELGQAREMAALAAASAASSYSGRSTAEAEADAEAHHHHAPSMPNGERSTGQHHLRQTMRGEDGGGGGGGVWAGRKRFSKRNSKSGLAAVF